MQLFYEPTKTDLNKITVLEKIGSDRLRKIDKVIKDSISDFMEKYGQDIFNFSDRTIASLIHDNMLKYCRHHLTCFKGVRIVSHNQTFKIVLDDVNITLQFKKFNNKYLTSNIHTRQVLRYMRQQGSLFPHSVNLSAGYRLNLSNLSGNFVPETILACPNNETTNNWVVNLDEIIQNIKTEVKDEPIYSETQNSPQGRQYKTMPKRNLSTINEKDAN